MNNPPSGAAAPKALLRGLTAPFVTYARWLHTGFPAGRVEHLPQVNEDFSTDVPGLYVAGDLAGLPLLKFAVHSGTRAVEAVHRSLGERRAVAGVRELVIVGAGVAGMAAALKAQQLGLDFVVVEASTPLSTLRELPARKPIYTYPTQFDPRGLLSISATSKESLLVELEQQLQAANIPSCTGRVSRVRRSGGELEVVLDGGAPIRALRVIIAVGRTGHPVELSVAGERLAHVHHRLVDAAPHAKDQVLVVGGGDSAVEAAISLAEAGARVTLVHRGDALSRPKSANVDRLTALRGDGAGQVSVRFSAKVARIDPGSVTVAAADGTQTHVAADAVFVLLGRDAPLALFRSSGVPVRGELRPLAWLSLALFLGACALFFSWKSGGLVHQWFAARGSWPFSLKEGAGDGRGLLSTVQLSASAPAFWYTLLYSSVVVVFGLRRMRRKKLPYVDAQTWTLIAIQVLPLFVLPEVLLPYLHHNDLLPAWLADPFFPEVGYGHGREFWRAYGLVLAWPLFVYNVFTAQALYGWLVLSVVQTFVLIPLGIRYFGKGFYCGWICSCGALAETLGDTQRHKMPHGPGWNRLNLAGQLLLLVALAMLGLRVAGWLIPGDDFADRVFASLLPGWTFGVDLVLASVLGVGLYFWFSGRVWCRFFCPLAALMNIYTRFSKFRIFPRKERCISCNVCTSICHQGIDVMAFASRGLPMSDPQCVRCSACVSACPTGVLEFGRFRADGSVQLDGLVASPVLARERTC